MRLTVILTSTNDIHRFISSIGLDESRLARQTEISVEVRASGSPVVVEFLVLAFVDICGKSIGVQLLFYYNYKILNWMCPDLDIRMLAASICSHFCICMLHLPFLFDNIFHFHRIFRILNGVFTVSKLNLKVLLKKLHFTFLTFFLFGNSNAEIYAFFNVLYTLCSFLAFTCFWTSFVVCIFVVLWKFSW